MLTATIIGVLAERLIRKLCTRCREEYEPEPELLKRLGLPKETHLFKAQGCRACKDTGYKGRLGLFELLIPDDEIFRMVLKGSANDEIRHYLLEQGKVESLRSDGLLKAARGLTTLEQVLGSTSEF